MIDKRRSFICGIKGKKLSKKEITFLKKYKPWGIILFARNIQTINQTQTLTNHIKKIFNDNKYPIMIDEEGGKVTRLKKFIDNSSFTARFFGNLYKKDLNKFNLFLDVYIKQTSYLLNLLGINLNAAPVLDVWRKKSHKIIGNRSYSLDSKIVSKIGDIFIDKFRNNRIASIIKHIPGHGLANVDSHIHLPIINRSYDYLKNNDFFPFKNKKVIFAMTAHILFKKQDPINCVTHSKKMISIIRNKIGFNNLIISDDISMKSLKHSISVNTSMAFTAGCNLVLHCNGNLREMITVAKNSPKLDKFILKKTSQFRDIIS